MDAKKVRECSAELYKSNELHLHFPRNRWTNNNRPVRKKFEVNTIIPEFNLVLCEKKNSRNFCPEFRNSCPSDISCTNL